MTVKLSNFAGAGGGGSKGGKIASNTLFSGSTLKVLDLISEGQIGGLVDGAKSIYFNDIPLQNASGTYNYENIEIDYVNGTADQKVLTDFGEVVTPHVVGIQVKHDLPVVASVENDEVDKVRIVVTLNSLYEADSKGNIRQTSVKFRFEVAVNSTGDWKPLGNGTYTISGKQNSEYQKSYSFDLPQEDGDGNKAVHWLIRMTRLSKDSDEKYSANTNFDTIYAVNSSRLNYPYSALVGIKASAENLGQIPTRSYLVDGMIIKVPSNYDPKTNTYSGVWDGTFKMAVSDNPAWILYALLTNTRWGLGDFISESQINKARLYEIGRYCDEEIDNGYGEKEKRFAINTQITERADAYQVISDIAAVFRGMVFWAGGTASFTCDMPTDPSMIYTASNVIDGLFTYQGTSRNDRHSVALVTWNDPSQNYKQVVEYVEDADLIRKWGIRQVELTAFGCTSRGQALRAGRWLLYTESYESDIISFSVGLDSALVLPGDVIEIQDPNYAGKRNGGRLVSCTKKMAMLDTNVYLTTKSKARIAIMMKDGSFVERNIIVSYNGNRKKIEWYEDLPDLPVANAIWMITEASLSPQIARVVNVSQGETAGTFQITAVSHQPKKFDLIEKGIEFVADATTVNDPLNVQPPSKPYVEEVLNDLGYGYVSADLQVTWVTGRNCVSYTLQWRREEENETDWATIETTQRSAKIEELQRGTYHFLLNGVGLLGTKTKQIEFYYEATNKYLTPLDVPSLEVIKRPNYLQVRWEPVSLATSYEVRCGRSWDDGEVLIENFAGTSFVHYQYTKGVFDYHIRAIGETGEYSPNVTSYRLVLGAPATPRDFTAVVYQDRIDFDWTANTEDDLSHYEIREGLNWESSMKVAISKISQTSIPAGSTAERTFWIKAVALPEIYSEEAAFVTVGIKSNSSRNLMIEYDGREMKYASNKVYTSLSGDDCVLWTDLPYGEYIHRMNLGDEITAQNTFNNVLATQIKTTDDKETWATANYDWDDERASRGWRVSGDTETVYFGKQIARHIGKSSIDLEGWSFDDKSPKSLNGLSPSVSDGIAYTVGRFWHGLKLDALAHVNYAKTDMIGSPDGTFRFSFWWKAENVYADQEFLFCSFGNSNKHFELYYEAGIRTFKLICGTEIVSVKCPYSIGKNWWAFICMSQTDTERTLGVGVLCREDPNRYKKDNAFFSYAKDDFVPAIAMNTENFAPIGTIDYLNIGDFAP